MTLEMFRITLPGFELRQQELHDSSSLNEQQCQDVEFLINTETLTALYLCNLRFSQINFAGD